jgi:polyhydroxybutyrate depolymerase
MCLMKMPWVNTDSILIMPLLLCIFLTGCMPRLPANGTVRGPNTYRVPTDFRTGNFKRDYLIHIPPGYDGRKKLPMVVVVHGAFDTAKGIEEIAGFNKIADRETFIVLYPNGIGILGYLQHWNAGHCCGKAQADDIDDVGFVSTAIESAGHQVQIDPTRIYMVGFSNGGMFTYRFASEKSHMLAGAAALAASIGSRTPADEKIWQIPQPTHSVPFLIMHGTADKSVPFEGKASQRKGTPRFYQSVEASVGFWRSKNGCYDALPPQQLLDGDAAQLTKWSDCTSGKTVWLIALKGWGHIWPGPYFTAKLKKDDPFKDFDAAEIIWNFFSNHGQ